MLAVTALLSRLPCSQIYWSLCRTHVLTQLLCLRVGCVGTEVVLLPPLQSYHRLVEAVMQPWMLLIP